MVEKNRIIQNKISYEASRKCKTLAEFDKKEEEEDDETGQKTKDQTE